MINENQLLKLLGVGFGVAVTVGGTIGTGILRKPGIISGLIGDPLTIMMLWLAVGIYAVLGTLCAIELAVSIPQAGAWYVYARRAFGNYFGFVTGITSWLGTVSALGFGAYTLSEYITLLMPATAQYIGLNAMTEKQGGSDLRETQTTARFSHTADYHGARADWYERTGHKWFCSVPQSDGFFTLAKVNGGATCFFLPRTLPDGIYNRFFVQRLKDKAGNKSNPSSEIEYSGTLAIRVGAEGKGLREILSHSHLTRLDFAVGSAGLMRQPLTLALQHTTTRRGFGLPLAEHPMMANVLADMAVEVGSHLCDRYIKEGYHVIAMDNLITGNIKNIEHLFPLKNVEYYHHDVSKFVHVPGKLDYILHFASPASPIDYLKMPIQTLKVGSLGIHNLLGLAKSKNARILIASKSEVYGDPMEHPQNENYWGNVNPIGPRGVYDEAKRFEEAITMAYHTFHGVETRIVRIFNTYGPRMRVEGEETSPL